MKIDKLLDCRVDHKNEVVEKTPRDVLLDKEEMDDKDIEDDTLVDQDEVTSI